MTLNYILVFQFSIFKPSIRVLALKEEASGGVNPECWLFPIFIVKVIRRGSWLDITIINLSKKPCRDGEAKIIYSNDYAINKEGRIIANHLKINNILRLTGFDLFYKKKLVSDLFTNCKEIKTGWVFKCDCLSRNPAHFY